MAQTRLLRWVVFVLLATVAIVAAVAAAAQDGAEENPNEVEEAAGEPGTMPAGEDLAGQSPNGEVEEKEARGALPGVPAPGAVTNHGKQFMVTIDSTLGNEPLNACPAGFHMASLYELHDVSALSYASDHAEAKTRADQGAGPVAGWWGWVRTGNDEYVTNIAGRANCSLWTSQAGGEYGSLVRLADTWTGAGGAISPWQAQTWPCAGTAPVWCIED